MHYFVLVIVPSDSDHKVAAEKLLSPFGANCEVESYTARCSCIGVDAYWDARTRVEAQIKPLEEYRQEYSALPTPRPEWEEFTKEFQEAVQRERVTHPLYQKPNPECFDCEGSGSFVTTYNPHAKWDYYDLGGRWAGLLNADNDSPVRMIEQRLIETGCWPVAILTPDGQWQESATADVEAWVHEVHQILASYQDGNKYIGMVYDLHFVQL